MEKNKEKIPKPISYGSERLKIQLKYKQLIHFPTNPERWRNNLVAETLLHDYTFIGIGDSIAVYNRDNNFLSEKNIHLIKAVCSAPHFDKPGESRMNGENHTYDSPYHAPTVRLSPNILNFNVWPEKVNTLTFLRTVITKDFGEILLSTRDSGTVAVHTISSSSCIEKNFNLIFDVSVVYSCWCVDFHPTRNVLAVSHNGWYISVFFLENQGGLKNNQTRLTVASSMKINKYNTNIPFISFFHTHPGADSLYYDRKTNSYAFKTEFMNCMGKDRFNNNISKSNYYKKFKTDNECLFLSTTFLHKVARVIVIRSPNDAKVIMAAPFKNDWGWTANMIPRSMFKTTKKTAPKPYFSKYDNTKVVLFPTFGNNLLTLAPLNPNELYLENIYKYPANRSHPLDQSRTLATETQYWLNHATVGRNLCVWLSIELCNYFELKRFPCSSPETCNLPSALGPLNKNCKPEDVVYIDNVEFSIDTDSEGDPLPEEEEEEKSFDNPSPFSMLFYSNQSANIQEEHNMFKLNNILHSAPAYSSNGSSFRRIRQESVDNSRRISSGISEFFPNSVITDGIRNLDIQSEEVANINNSFFNGVIQENNNMEVDTPVENSSGTEDSNSFAWNNSTNYESESGGNSSYRTANDGDEDANMTDYAEAVELSNQSRIPNFPVLMHEIWSIRSGSEHLQMRIPNDYDNGADFFNLFYGHKFFPNTDNIRRTANLEIIYVMRVLANSGRMNIDSLIEGKIPIYVDPYYVKEDWKCLEILKDYFMFHTGEDSIRLLHGDTGKFEAFCPHVFNSRLFQENNYFMMPSRLNLVVPIPSLSAIVIASQIGMVTIVQCCYDEEGNDYSFTQEFCLPLIQHAPLSYECPLLGISVIPTYGSVNLPLGVTHAVLKLIYFNGVVLTYDLFSKTDLLDD